VNSKKVLVDIDGTIALRGNRSPYDWKSVGNDKPNIAVITLVQALFAAGHEIIFISGRSSICREETLRWLSTNVIVPTKLLMRAVNDSRSDEVVKKELVSNFISDFSEILLVIDDRARVVKMWRHDLGLTCIQVSDGDQ